jgi:hypothetical protein
MEKWGMVVRLRRVPEEDYKGWESFNTAMYLTDSCFMGVWQ